MPELPEVETVCRGLARALPGQRISEVILNRGGLRIPFPEDLARIKGRKVTSIGRRAKYILVHLAQGKTLLIHLGMSGRLILLAKNAAYKPARHDHMILALGNGLRIVFSDTKGLDRHPLLAHLGPEPLEKEFSAAYLAGKIRNRKTAIKLAIMDQRLVVGVGNIYASEALFAAGIDPRRAANTLKSAEVQKLVTAIRRVLRQAIEAGGSSLRDYVQADGELGRFQHRFAVYGKTGRKCKGCICNPAKTGGVHGLVQGGRSTFYCPVKQA
jgi:formamidopyrimidine-DNA glycosylase